METPITLIPLLSFNSKLHLWNDGIKDICDIDLKNPPSPLSTSQQLVVESIRKNKLIILDTLPPLLETLQFPLYFLDFEAYIQAVPSFPNLFPQTFVISQVSIHVLEKPGGLLRHFEMIVEPPGRDGRLDVANMLIRVLKTSGSIIVWHSTFEVGRIKELTSLFPNLDVSLQAIISRIVDLYRFVRNRMHHPDMRGSYSLKNVTKSIIPQLKYDSLQINNGEAAMAAYASAAQGKVSGTDWILLRENMLEYCKRDTYVMVEILRFLVARCGVGPNVGPVESI